MSFPLASHFEQRYHVRHRLDRYGATSWLEYEDASPEVIAAAIAKNVGRHPSYRPVEARVRVLDGGERRHFAPVHAVFRESASLTRLHLALPGQLVVGLAFVGSPRP